MKMKQIIHYMEHKFFFFLNECFLSNKKSWNYPICDKIYPTVIKSFSSFSSVQNLSHVWLFATTWTAAHQASLSITNSWSLLKFMSIELVMPSNHLNLCCPLFLLPSIFPSIRLFSNELALPLRWPKFWSFRFSISPSSEYSDEFPLGLTGLISLPSKELSRIFSRITIQKCQVFSG